MLGCHKHYCTSETSYRAAAVSQPLAEGSQTHRHCTAWDLAVLHLPDEVLLHWTGLCVANWIAMALQKLAFPVEGLLAFAQVSAANVTLLEYWWLLGRKHIGLPRVVATYLFV